MKTKAIAPWKLKVGMQLAPLRVAGEPPRSPHAIFPLGEVVSVVKGRGRFTGGSVWNVVTSTGEKLLFHGRHGGLEAEHAFILTP